MIILCSTGGAKGSVRIRHQKKVSLMWKSSKFSSCLDEAFSDVPNSWNGDLKDFVDRGRKFFKFYQNLLNVPCVLSNLQRRFVLFQSLWKRWLLGEWICCLRTPAKGPYSIASMLKYVHGVQRMPQKEEKCSLGLVWYDFSSLLYFTWQFTQFLFMFSYVWKVQTIMTIYY